tara:strand:- start:880 stop:1434 length:555 start_codon:yes stop_codon:yes gene_type:complete
MNKYKSFPDWRNFHTIIFDFDGIFTDNKVYLNEDGNESIMCDRSDGLAFDILRKFKDSNMWEVDYFILSKEKNKVVKKRAEKLKIKVFNDVSNKEKFIKNYLINKFGDYSESRNGVLYLGNDLNDLSAIKLCGYSIAPANSHYIIKEQASLNLSSFGGNGFIREVIEKIIKINDMTLEEIQKMI